MVAAAAPTDFEKLRRSKVFLLISGATMAKTRGLVELRVSAKANNGIATVAIVPFSYFVPFALAFVNVVKMAVAEFCPDVTAVAERTGYPEITFLEVMNALSELELETPVDVCSGVLRGLSLTHAEPLEDVLRELELEKSIDVGVCFWSWSI